MGLVIVDDLLEYILYITMNFQNEGCLHMSSFVLRKIVGLFLCTRIVLDHNSKYFDAV